MGITGWRLQPKTVLARTWPVARAFESHVAPGSDAETHFASLILCEGGPTISYERGEYVAAPKQEAWHIVGTLGSLRCQMTTAEDKQIVHEDAASKNDVTARVVWEGQEDADVVHAGPIQDFARAIVDGTEPQTSLANSLVIQKVTDAVYASAERGVAVEVD